MRKFKKPSVKNLFVSLAFLCFFSLALFLVWKRLLHSVESSISPELMAQFSQQNQPTPPAQPQVPPPSPPQATPLPYSADVLPLLALELARGVADTHIPLSLFKEFLSKVQAPWASSLFTTLAPLQTIESYATLEASLSIPQPQPSSSPLSLWQRIKNKLKTFISLHRIENDKESALETLEPLQAALYFHDIGKALAAFETLSPEQKQALAAWKTMAENRLLFETAYKTLLATLVTGAPQ